MFCRYWKWFKNIGSIIASYDETQIRNLTGNIKNQLGDKELKNAFAVLILNDYNDYKNYQLLVSALNY